MTRSRVVLAAVGVTGVFAGLGVSNAIAAVPAAGARTDAVAASPAATSPVATPPVATSPDAAGRAPSDAAAVTSAVRRVMGTASIPGAIVGVWRPGQPAYVKAFGVRNRRTRQPMSPGLYMRIGSETEDLHRHRGACSWSTGTSRAGRSDRPSYLDGVPDGDLITIRELAEMRSGLSELHRRPGLRPGVKRLQADPYRRWTPRQDCSPTASSSQKMLFRPGTSFNYSNTNYVLLGLLVETLSGQPLADLHHAHILQPSHLDHTLVPAWKLPFPSRPTPRLHQPDR